MKIEPVAATLPSERIRRRPERTDSEVPRRLRRQVPTEASPRYGRGRLIDEYA